MVLTKLCPQASCFTLRLKVLVLSTSFSLRFSLSARINSLIDCSSSFVNGLGSTTKSTSRGSFISPIVSLKIKPYFVSFFHPTKLGKFYLSGKYVPSGLPNEGTRITQCLKLDLAQYSSPTSQRDEMFVAICYSNESHDPTRGRRSVSYGNYLLQTCHHAVMED